METTPLDKRRAYVKHGDQKELGIVKEPRRDHSVPMHGGWWEMAKV